jgi:hypothetical protein
MDANDGIVLIQLQRDLLASTLADAIRRTADLSLVEPAPSGPEMLNALKADHSGKPIVIVIGKTASLDAYAATIEAARPDLVIVTIPIDQKRIKLGIPGLALDDVVSLLLWLSGGHAGAVEIIRRSGGGSAWPAVSRPKSSKSSKDLADSVVSVQFRGESTHRVEICFR